MKKSLFMLSSVILMSAVFSTASYVSASTESENEIPIISNNTGDKYEKESDHQEILTSDGMVLNNPDVFTDIQLREATGQHSTATVVSSHVTKNKLLKVLTGYTKGPGTTSISKGKSLSGSVSVSNGTGTVSFSFGGSVTEGHSVKVPSGKYGAIAYYGTVTAKRYLIRVYNNSNNSLATSYYTTQCSLSNKYYGIHYR